MNLGVNTYTYPWAFGLSCLGVTGYPDPVKRMTAIELINRAVESGIKVVQICNNYPLHKLSKNELNKIADKALENGIIIETGTWGVEPELLLKYLEISKLLNSSLLRTVIVKNDGTAPEPKEVIKWLKEVMPAFESAGISIAIENYERFKNKDMVGIIESVGSKNLGVCLDTLNSFGALEGPEQVYNLLIPYTISLHIKDFRISRVPYFLGYVVEGCPAGKGALDVKELLDSLLKAGKDPNAIVEIFTPYQGTIDKTMQLEYEWATESFSYLKKLVKKI